MNGHSEIKFASTPLSILFVIAIAWPSPAAADSRVDPRFEATGSKYCAHRFEPGPIVNGHNRQPTPAEFESRIRQYTCSQNECSPLSQGGSPAIAAKNKPLTPGICL
jgi:hypothetical protein